MEASLRQQNSRLTNEANRKIKEGNIKAERNKSSNRDLL